MTLPPPPTVVVIARVPAPGLAKTRLIPALGAGGAAALCRAMTADVLALVRASALPYRVAWGGDRDDAWATGLGAPSEAQAEGDLGVRLAHALREGGIAIGTDAPTLPVALLTAAAAALHHHDVVFVPAFDGGYALIGVRDPAVAGPGGIFDDIPWSSADTYAASIERARALGLRHASLGFWYDIDEPRDLAFLQAQLRVLPPHVAAHTRAFLQEHPHAPPHR
ncbi:MAG: TIGR04282 family arsenosugar biosynthesis glycosyltransferase [Pseudomonadota bacterium]|nr:TIGR04282 family arsenosugar biosynthesis glycosyltransferase [Pseudomonadota bacterium]